MGRGVAGALGLALLLAAVPARASAEGPAPRVEIVSLRGVPQTLHVYGEGDRIALVISGDGGWMHLGPEVAEFLAGQGYRVVGVDAKGYLASFTSRMGPLDPADVPRDFQALLALVDPKGTARPLLVGVSEGAGLSVLAASSPMVRDHIAGVVALGLPDRNELGWRFRDSLIYLTKKTPEEPTFSASDVVSGVAPVPLAAIHSSHDEFVPVAEVQAVLERAREPKRLWVVDASDHRFGGARPQLEHSLLEAIAWIGSERGAGP